MKRRSGALVHVGIAVGLTAAGLTGFGVVRSAGAAPVPATGSSHSPASFVPIAPCRLFDTRPGSDNVGPRATPLAADSTFVMQVTGTNGNCSIPAGTSGVSLNVTIINPSAPSFLTVFPSDAPRPLAANLNWVAHQAPTPNAVTVALSASGQASFYNLGGTVDLAADVVGYYSTTPPTGGPHFGRQMILDTSIGGGSLVLPHPATQAAVVVGLDGLPVVAFSALTALEIFHCTTPSCLTSTSSAPAGSTGISGISMTLGAESLPIIAFHDAGSQTLKVAHCATQLCGTATVSPVASDGSADLATSITVGTDGMAVIAYTDGNAGDLRLAHCSNLACTTSTTQAVDTAHDTGYQPSVAIGSDGLPVISYLDATDGVLRVAHCTDAVCTSSQRTTVDQAVGRTLGRNSSIAIGADGLPIISSLDSAPALHVVHCGDVACQTSSVVTVPVSPVADEPTSIAIGPDGLAMLTAVRTGSSTLPVVLVHCTDPVCQTSTSVEVATPPAVAGVAPALAFSTQGEPIVAYTNEGTGVPHLVTTGHTAWVPNATGR